MAEKLEIKKQISFEEGKNRLRIPVKGVPCHLANTIQLHKTNLCTFTEALASHGEMTGQIKPCAVSSFLVKSETGSSSLPVLDAAALPLGAQIAWHDVQF